MLANIIKKIAQKHADAFLIVRRAISRVLLEVKKCVITKERSLRYVWASVLKIQNISDNIS